MYIDGDTHYWPLRFLDKVSHPGKGYIEIGKDDRKYIRFGEVVPGATATYYRDGNKVHSFKEGRWSLSLRAEYMRRSQRTSRAMIDLSALPGSICRTFRSPCTSYGAP